MCIGEHSERSSEAKGPPSPLPGWQGGGAGGAVGGMNIGAFSLHFQLKLVQNCAIKVGDVQAAELSKNFNVRFR